MRVFRFMSEEEFERYRHGIKLKNNKKHNEKTNSIGFCFFSTEDFTPEEAMHFLSGIVSFDICAIFEVKQELMKSYGIYAKPIKTTGNYALDLINILARYSENFRADEYCTTEYDSKNMELIKHSENLWEQWGPLEKQKEFKWIA